MFDGCSRFVEYCVSFGWRMPQHLLVQLGLSQQLLRSTRLQGGTVEVTADMSKNPTWQKDQVSCVWTSDPLIGLGSTYDEEARFLGPFYRSWS